MRKYVFVIEAVLLLMVVLTYSEVGDAQSNEIQTKGKVCPNPSAPCVKIINKRLKIYPDGTNDVISKGENIFEDSDLLFRIPAKLV